MEEFLEVFINFINYKGYKSTNLILIYFLNKECVNSYKNYQGYYLVRQRQSDHRAEKRVEIQLTLT